MSKDPAFPQNPGVWHPGLSKRELFAAMIVQGFLAMPTERAEVWGETDGHIITVSVKLADLLLHELAKKEKA